MILHCGDYAIPMPDWVKPGHLIAWDEDGSAWVYEVEPVKNGLRCWSRRDCVTRVEQVGHDFLEPPESGPWTEQLYVLEEFT